MKKIISLVLALLLCFALVSCGEKKPDLYDVDPDIFGDPVDTEYNEFPTGA